MDTVTLRDQALKISAQIATQVNWNELCGKHLQNQVLALTPDEFERRFTLFLQRGGLIPFESGFEITPLPFHPDKILGEKWKIIKEDERSLALTRVDLAKAIFFSYLKKGEKTIEVKEKLLRLEKSGETPLDARFCMALHSDSQKNRDKCLLRRLYDQGVIKGFVDFPGTILSDNGGDDFYILCIYGACADNWTLDLSKLKGTSDGNSLSIVIP